jgi:hypothetical protein
MAASQRVIRWLAAAALVGVVTSCSGGEGDSTKSVPVSPGSTLFPIATAAPAPGESPTTVADTVAPTTVPVPTTFAPGVWPPDAPFVDLTNPDHIERTRQLEAFYDWKSSDSSRLPNSWTLWTRPGSPMEVTEIEKLDAPFEINNCVNVIESIEMSERTDEFGLWVKTVSYSDPCSGTRDGEPGSRDFVLDADREWLWVQQLDGTWVVEDFRLTTKGRV